MAKFQLIECGNPSGTPLLLLDNYDSFTYNIVQYLMIVDPSIRIIVARNDAITISEIKNIDPRWIIISPGPGHPRTDSGICLDVIRQFRGKKPIFGICMGLQCIISQFDGIVDHAGEIIHGKTSLIEHDGKGLFKNVPSGIAATRYHSLAGNLKTIPSCLTITCRSPKGIIMGVRHKDYTIEGVQFHPESILTEGGKLLFHNFLNLSEGTWNAEKIKNSETKHNSILETIIAKREQDVQQISNLPGKTLHDLQIAHSLALCPPLLDFEKRIRSSIHDTGIALMAEFKRNSPSKSISPNANAPKLVLQYAKAGAAVISCLTEPTWFDGSNFDLLSVRRTIESVPNRPALLRKDFIFDPYQIWEARVYGADSILLIVKALQPAQLVQLFRLATMLKMQPLVEVNCESEMELALSIGAKVIGVNNRDLNTFEIDLTTSSRCAKLASDDTIVCALSGISQPSEIKNYLKDGIKGFLIGSSLMMSENPYQQIERLLSVEKTNASPLPPIVKVCGIRSMEAAKVAIEAGADFVGLISAPSSHRFVSPELIREISSLIRKYRKSKITKLQPLQIKSPDYFERNAAKAIAYGPYSVAVVRNMNLDEIEALIAYTQVDFIQLHGDEPLEWTRFISVPCLKAFSIHDLEYRKPGFSYLSLIDGTDTKGRVVGGTGLMAPLDVVKQAVQESHVRPLLSGGLNPNNVAEALAVTGAIGVDAASGIETDGQVDLEKIKNFIYNAKQFKYKYFS